MTHTARPKVGISLRDVLASEVRIIGSPEVRAVGCTSHWRHVRRGDAYVAITGPDTDGHDSAVDAAHRGAAAIICERPLPVFNVPQFIVRDTRDAYGQLCQALVGDPSRELKVIGISGTHGKTTVARLLGSIFRAAGLRAGVMDSLGDWNGKHDSPPSAGALSPPAIARSLAEMAADGATHALLEAASTELSQRTLAGVQLDAACITHIGRGSLDWHGSVAKYRDAERRVLEHVTPEAVLVLNADDPFSMDILADIQQPVLTFGLRQQAEITADIIEQHASEQIFVLSAGDDSAAVRTAMVGDHHVANCLAAAATALAYGIELTTIARGLESVERLPGRMERVLAGQEFAVFVDAARSPNALRAVLRAARQATNGRVICVFGPQGEREAIERPVTGRVVGAMADMAIVTSADALGDVPQSVLLDVRRGFAAPQSAEMITSRAEAIAFALEAARPGDAVVVAGMGPEQFAVGDGGQTLTDREVVHEVLGGAVSTATWPRLAA